MVHGHKSRSLSSMTYYSLPSDYGMWKKNAQTIIVLLVPRRKISPKRPENNFLNSRAEL